VGTKAFILLVVLVAGLGAGLGASLVAANGRGGEADSSGSNTPSIQTPQASDDAPAPDVGGATNADSPETSVDEATGDAPATGERQQPRGGLFASGGAIEPITGTVVSLSTDGLTLETTAGPVEVPLAADTPMQIRKTAHEAESDLVPGLDATIVLVRTPEGIINVRTISLGKGGFESRLLGGGDSGRGGRGGGGGGGDRQATEFNAVTGAIVAFGGGTITIENTEGSVEAVVTDDTPVRISRLFSEASGDLAPGTEITVIGQRAEDGQYQAFMITTGALQDSGLGRFGGGRRGQQGGSRTLQGS
jgi:hypothetical protein